MASRALKKRKNVRKKDVKSAILAILFVIAITIFVSCIGLYFLCTSWLKDIPDYTNIDKMNNRSVSKVYASDEKTVLAEFQLENRDPVELSQVSDYVKRGTIATEDERFYSHNGFDVFGTVRAVFNNMLGGSIEGGSTITMQLVRNTVISDEMTDRTLRRKIREAYISLKIEELYSKDEILQMYLNTINYGNGAFGIEAASQRYFSKKAKDLTINEAATLIGIPQSPTYNNPIENMENCIKRRNLVLSRMKKHGVITEEEAAAAKAEEIVLKETVKNSTGIHKYPYFTSYVRNQLTATDNKYSITAADLFGGGLDVVTTLDVSAQDKLEQAGNARSRATGFQIAGVAIDPSNGYIKAVNGGADFSKSELNMATGDGTNGRQCGSSFKVFTLLAALEAGIDPANNIDAGYKIETNGAEVFNYGKANYGTRSIGSALAISSNTAFVRLCQSVGPDKVIEMAHRLGISSEMNAVPVVTLGVASVTPLEMAGAFATIANGGTFYKPECIKKITDSSGKVLADNSNPSGKRAISAEIACAATEAMKMVLSSSGTGYSARISSGQSAAGKTGTSDNWKDSWFVGFTPQICLGLWMGDAADTYAAARSIPSGIDVAPVFATFCNNYLNSSDLQEFPVAEKPVFKSNFSDVENHIGGRWGYSYSYYYNTIYNKNYKKNTTYNYSYNYGYSYNNSGSNSNNSSSGRSGGQNSSSSNSSGGNASSGGNSGNQGQSSGSGGSSSSGSGSSGSAETGERSGGTTSGQ